MPGAYVQASGTASGNRAGKRRTRRMNVCITNRQEAHKVSLNRITRFFSQMAQNLQRMNPDIEWSDLSLVLTDNAGIRRINSRYLHVADTTDVIAFRYTPLPCEKDNACGEIFVNVERAVENGPVYGDSSRELALYIAHGCDHLSGQSDDSKAGYLRMRRRELRWLKTAAAAGLLRRPLLAGTGARRAGTS
jgi:rRNA maturation RNase YbeY